MIEETKIYGFNLELTIWDKNKKSEVSIAVHAGKDSQHVIYPSCEMALRHKDSAHGNNGFSAVALQDDER